MERHRWVRALRPAGAGLWPVGFKEKIPQCQVTAEYSSFSFSTLHDLPIGSATLSFILQGRAVGSKEPCHDEGRVKSRAVNVWREQLVRALLKDLVPLCSCLLHSERRRLGFAGLS